MTTQKESRDEIRARIKPTLDKVAVKGLRAWLKAIGLSSAAYTRPTITNLVADEIAEGRLAEEALEKALIGFEEASDMRIYLYRLDELPKGETKKWLPTRLLNAGFAITKSRTFAGEKTKPMCPVYAELEGELLRMKWAEQHESLKIDDKTGKVVSAPVDRRIVFIADLHSKTAELRMNPPETRHPHEDAAGRTPAELYYQAYSDKVRDLLNCTFLPIEWRPIVRKLVEEEQPRVVRIHIDNHTNQSNTKAKTHASRADVRDDPDWKLAYKENGGSWAWDAQSFYWLPKASHEFLTRELYSHIDAEDGYVKVNADCSDEEVNYVVSQIRAR
jgi:hypothetical protein